MSWSQSWYVVTLTGLFEGHPVLQVAGDVSAPAVASLALASAAGFAAIAISGPFFRFVLAALEAALGASIAASAAFAIAAPVSTVSSAVTEATGLEGAVAVERLMGSLTATVWPFVALCAGVLLTLLGIGILVTGGMWPPSGRRYEPVRFEPADSVETSSGDAAVSDWDELSGGSDPTSR
jgi:uncharacterized membrane protein (TIGR02234 family)